jgi:hypothetical protein
MCGDRYRPVKLGLSSLMCLGEARSGGESVLTHSNGIKSIPFSRIAQDQYILYFLLPLPPVSALDCQSSRRSARSGMKMKWKIFSSKRFLIFIISLFY